VFLGVPEVNPVQDYCNNLVLTSSEIVVAIFDQMEAVSPRFTLAKNLSIKHCIVSEVMQSAKRGDP